MFRNTTQGENVDVRPTYSYINPNSTLYNKLDYLHTFSPTLLNEVGLAYNRLTGSQPAKVPFCRTPVSQESTTRFGSGGHRVGYRIIFLFTTVSLGCTARTAFTSVWMCTGSRIWMTSPTARIVHTLFQ